MDLSEKITYCRRRSGLSQEGLAEKLGVSRQAVSKWETGEAQPEIAKLKQLSDVFGVSADWLLNEEEPIEPQAPVQAQAQTPSFLDRLPGIVGKLFRRFGWLAGVYTMIIGVIIGIVGGASILISEKLIGTFQQNSSHMFDAVNGYGIGAAATSIVNPVAVAGKIVIGIGAVILVIGIVLTIVLLRVRKEEQNKE